MPQGTLVLLRRSIVNDYDLSIVPDICQQREDGPVRETGVVEVSTNVSNSHDRTPKFLLRIQ